MQRSIDQALRTFRGNFSRYSSWLLFCAVVIGFMGATEENTIIDEIRAYFLKVSDEIDDN